MTSEPITRQRKKRHAYALWNWPPSNVVYLNAAAGLITVAGVPLAYIIGTILSVGMVGAANGAVIGFSMRAFDCDFSFTRISILTLLWGVGVPISYPLGLSGCAVSLLAAIILTFWTLGTRDMILALVTALVASAVTFWMLLIGVGILYGILYTVIPGLDVGYIADFSLSILGLVSGAIIGGVRGLALVGALPTRPPDPRPRPVYLAPGLYALGDDGELVEMPDVQSTSAISDRQD